MECQQVIDKVKRLAARVLPAGSVSMARAPEAMITTTAMKLIEMNKEIYSHS